MPRVAIGAVYYRLRRDRFACGESARREADERGSRLSARVTARLRRRDGRRADLRAAGLPFRGGSGTPARRAFERPMAMACLLERAPCLPWRTCSISSRTNSPAAVVGALPSLRSFFALLMVFRSGMGGSCARPLRGAGKLVEVIDERAHGRIEAGNLRIAALDQVVLVRRVRAAAVAEAEVARGQLQGRAGEDVPGPRPGVARPEQRIDAGLLVRLHLRPN